MNPETLLPEAFPIDGFEIFPFSQPAVFRSGPYLVHRISEPIGKLATDFDPLKRKRLTAAELRYLHSNAVERKLAQAAE